MIKKSLLSIFLVILAFDHSFSLPTKSLGINNDGHYLLINTDGLNYHFFSHLPPQANENWYSGVHTHLDNEDNPIPNNLNMEVHLDFIDHQIALSIAAEEYIRVYIEFLIANQVFGEHANPQEAENYINEISFSAYRRFYTTA